MNLIDVLFLSLKNNVPSRDYWDMGMIEEYISNKLYKTGFQFNIEEVNEVPDHLEGAIVVFPARAQKEKSLRLNKELSKLKWVILLLTGDEESVFPVEKIKHNNIDIWVMSPKKDRHDSYNKLLTGYPKHINKYREDSYEKTNDWFFSGQVTHSRRQQCVDELKKTKRPGVLVETEGFTQGLEHKEYYDNIKKAKITLCPSGPKTVDTFRMCESMEFGSIPIVDNKTPEDDTPEGYWEWFFKSDELPFVTIDNWKDVHGYMNDILDSVHTPYSLYQNVLQTRWIKYKRDFTRKLEDSIKKMSDREPWKHPISVVIPVSPIKSHPDTSILIETIDSVRHHLPKSEIHLTFDGVRHEQKDRHDDYFEFVRRIMILIKQDGNIYPHLYLPHMHQTGMMRDILDKIETEYILYVESDTPLVTDHKIDFRSMLFDLDKGTSNMIRLHFEAVIPKEHYHMMLGVEGNTFTPLMRTCQWSQRPHVASRAFYRRILDSHFSLDTRSFIEDKMHGVLHEAYLQDGKHGWDQFKVHIYIPEGGNIKRSYHTDGRQGESKWDDTQVF